MTDMNDWADRVERAWASIDAYEGREPEFRALIDDLADELPPGSPYADFERACAWDSTGYPGNAVTLYRQALDKGLTGLRRRRAVIQLSSSLRNVGQAAESVRLLEAERDRDRDLLDDEEKALDDALLCVLALGYVELGREREAVSVTVGALARHLPRYQRSMAAYARNLIHPEA